MHNGNINIYLLKSQIYILNIIQIVDTNGPLKKSILNNNRYPLQILNPYINVFYFITIFHFNIFNYNQSY